MIFIAFDCVQKHVSVVVDGSSGCTYLNWRFAPVQQKVPQDTKSFPIDRFRSFNDRKRFDIVRYKYLEIFFVGPEQISLNCT